MKLKLLALSLLLWAPLCAQELIRPSTPANLAEHLKLLDDGSCTLKGTAFVEQDGLHFALPGEVVTLIPLTPYLSEYLALVKEHGGEKVAIDPAIASCGILTGILDDKGHFVIPNLKPGRYMVTTRVHWAGRGSQRVEVSRTNGYDYWGNQIWSKPNYQTQVYDYQDIQRVTATIDLKAENQTLEVVLSK